jgi:(p)ppGpp synthase/HD superfamily hydrolase
MSWNPDLARDALRLAAEGHGAQTFPGTDLPYLLHVSQVAMEVMAVLAQRRVSDPDLAVLCAILHDSVEDSAGRVTLEGIEARFGRPVRDGVDALTKRAAVGGKPARMADSLRRIQAQPQEVWMVKLADRITNLQPPPAHWDRLKIARYQEEARSIHAALGDACPILGRRLAAAIEAYGAPGS